MKNVLFSFVIIIINSFFSFSQDTQYLKLLKDYLKGNEGVDFVIYEYRKILESGEGPELWNCKISSPFKNSKLYFIDDSPFSDWGHQCRYVFIDIINDEFNVISKNYPPKSYDDFKLISKLKVSSGQKFDFSGLKTQKCGLVSKAPINGSDEIFGNKYAIIINGAYNMYNNHERYWNHCEAIYNTLIYYYGFEKTKTLVLNSDGNDGGADMHLIGGGYANSSTDFDNDGLSDVTNNSTKAAINLAFLQLRMVLKPEDFLFVFVTDHGGDEGVLNDNEVTFACWNEDEMRDDEFALLIDGIECKKAITMVQCFSGGFIDDLDGENGVITTSCLANETATARPDLLYSEFVFHWTAGVLGKYPNGTTANADSDSDGFVSFLEASNFAREHDQFANGVNASEHPQYSSNPNAFGAEMSLFGFEKNIYLNNIIIGDEEQKYFYCFNASLSNPSGYFHIESGASVIFGVVEGFKINGEFKAPIGSQFKVANVAFVKP